MTPTELMQAPYKIVERELGIKIRNGQTMEGIRKAILWMQKNKKDEEILQNRNFFKLRD